MLAVLMVLSLAACGKTPAEPTQTPSTQPSTETPTTEATEPASTYAIDTLTVGTTPIAPCDSTSRASCTVRRPRVVPPPTPQNTGT